MKKTGLVLTGGSLRGVCTHTGALLALEEKGYVFDAVIGTSAGAIVGSLYTAGLEAEEIRRRLAGLRRDDYQDPDHGELVKAVGRSFEGWTGYYRGEALLAWLKENLGEKRIEESSPPLYLVVANVSRGYPQVKNEGPLAEFARASSSIPLLYQLQQVDGEYYADGGLVDNVPAAQLAEIRPDLDQFLVVTSLRLEMEEPEPDNGFLERSFTPIRALERIVDAISKELRLDDLDVGDRELLELSVDPIDISLDEPERLDECIQSAYEDAKRKIENGEVDLTQVRRQLIR